MAREKMFDPQFQKCFTEAIHRENAARMKWHVEYGSRIAHDSAVKWDESSDEEEEEPKAKKELKAEPKSSEAKRPSAEEDTAVVPWPATSASGTTGVTRIADPPPLMKAVDPNAKVLLFQGISHDGEGRAQYLKYRNRKDPEAKYTFPVCSSWEYGWKYGQEQEELTFPTSGRCNIIQQSFYRPNETQLKSREDDYY